MLQMHVRSENCNRPRFLSTARRAFAGELTVASNTIAVACDRQHGDHNTQFYLSAKEQEVYNQGRVCGKHEVSRPEKSDENHQPRNEGRCKMREKLVCRTVQGRFSMARDANC